MIGRHQMTPLLSPKKTWEGGDGGLLGGALATIAIDQLVSPRRSSGSTCSGKSASEFPWPWRECWATWPNR